MFQIEMNYAYNALFRKIINNCWNASVTVLQHFLKHPTWEELVKKGRNGFVQKIHKSGFDSLSPIYLLTVMLAIIHFIVIVLTNL